MHVRHHLAQDLTHPDFMSAIDVGIDKANRDGFDITLFQHLRHAAGLILIKLGDDLACRINPFLHSQAVAARDIGFGNVFIGVPEVFFVRPPDFHHIAKAFGADHRRARQVAGDERIGGDGRAMRKHRNISKINLGVRYTRHDRAHRIIRGRWCFLNPDLAGTFIHDANVSECPPDVDCYSCFCHS